MSAQQEQEHELIQLREEKKVTLPARARDLRPHRHFSRRTPARWPSTESPLAVLPPKSLAAALAEKQAEVDQVIALFSPGTPVCCQQHLPSSAARVCTTTAPTALRFN